MPRRRMPVDAHPCRTPGATACACSYPSRTPSKRRWSGPTCRSRSASSGTRRRCPLAPARRRAIRQPRPLYATLRRRCAVPCRAGSRCGTRSARPRREGRARPLLDSRAQWLSRAQLDDLDQRSCVIDPRPPRSRAVCERRLALRRVEHALARSDATHRRADSCMGRGAECTSATSPCACCSTRSGRGRCTAASRPGSAGCSPASHSTAGTRTSRSPAPHRGTCRGPSTAARARRGTPRSS